jgi:glycosyltransferase involved in cell wall biosynthesis
MISPILPNVSIGVIIPLFNKINQIERALTSICSQSLPFSEIIIVDDCSTDGSLEFVLAFKAKYDQFPIVILQHNNNQGPSAARNLGLDHLKSDYFCFLDADDFFAVDFLEKISLNVNFLNENIFFIYLVRESSLNISRPSIKNISKFCQKITDEKFIIHDWINANLVDTLFCSGGNVFMSKSIATNFRFDLESRNFEDWHFYYQVCQYCHLNNIQIEIGNFVGLNYSDDDQNSLSRKRKINSNNVFPPKLVFDSFLPIPVRKHTMGIWLIHLFQRISFFDRISVLFKVLSNKFNLKPPIRLIFFSILCLVLGYRGWSLFSRIRKNYRYD